MLFDFAVLLIGILLGFYFDGLKQIGDSVVSWLNDTKPAKEAELYTIKYEDYYDGRRDS